jgi:hypothetical protein
MAKVKMFCLFWVLAACQLALHPRMQFVLAVLAASVPAYQELAKPEFVQSVPEPVTQKTSRPAFPSFIPALAFAQVGGIRYLFRETE